MDVWPLGSSLALVVCGFVVGSLVAATGVGAGSLTTPLLVVGFGVHPAVAVGTDLLFAATTKLVAAGWHHKLGNVNARVLGGLALGSLPAAVATLAALGYFAIDTHMLAGVIRNVLAVILLITVAAILARPVFAGPNGPDGPQGAARLWHLAAVGIVLGVVVALTSIGAGAIGVVALAVVAPALSARRIVGTDIAHAIPLTIVCGAGHFMLGNTNFQVLAMLLAGSIPGVMFGSRLSLRLPDKVLRGVLAAVLALAAVLLLLK